MLESIEGGTKICNGRMSQASCRTHRLSLSLERRRGFMMLDYFYWENQWNPHPRGFRGCLTLGYWLLALQLHEQLEANIVYDEYSPPILSSEIRTSLVRGNFPP